MRIIFPIPTYVHKGPNADYYVLYSRAPSMPDDYSPTYTLRA